MTLGLDLALSWLPCSELTQLTLALGLLPTAEEIEEEDEEEQDEEEDTSILKSSNPTPVGCETNEPNRV